MAVNILFWYSFFFICFTYVGYPLILLVQSRLLPRPVDRTSGCNQPFVSIVIAAKNEAPLIARRIVNLLEQNYPASKLEIIIISDGSNDNTVSILQDLSDNFPRDLANISVYAYTPSKGKPSALNMGVEFAKGDIIVFADARQQFEKNTVSQLVSNFSDSTIGGVSGELVFLKESNSKIKAQMGAYWIYEKNIRKMESMSGSVVGVTGAVYAIRRKLYQNLPPETILDDVLTPMNIIMQGYRVIFDSNALAYDSFSKDVSQEWKRKVRTLAGNWQLMSLRSDLFNPCKNKLIFRFFFHKIARLLVPFFLFILLITSILQSGIFFRLISSMQVFLYTIAIASHFFPNIQQNFAIKSLYFFCSLNYAAIIAFFVWSTGRISTIWVTKDVK